MPIISADIAEPINPVTVDSTTAWTADSTTWPTADVTYLPAADTSDAIAVAAGAAILAEAAAAADVLDADVVSAEVPVYGGGGYYPWQKPFPVDGVGFGILPEIRGEAFGVVALVGNGNGILPEVVGAAAGTAGVVGRSAAQFVVRGTAIGVRGQVGTGAAVLKGLSVASAGAVGARGSGSGMVMKFKAAGRGRHDDDEAAVMAFLLAA